MQGISSLFYSGSFSRWRRFAVACSGKGRTGQHSGMRGFGGKESGIKKRRHRKNDRRHSPWHPADIFPQELKKNDRKTFYSSSIVFRWSPATRLIRPAAAESVCPTATPRNCGSPRPNGVWARTRWFSAA